MIELARLSDLQLLIEFIKNEWSQHHIFVKQPALLAWQHKCLFDDSRLNFLVSKSFSGRINGCLGIIPAQLHKDDSHSPLVWLAIWKSSASNRGSSLGLDLLDTSITIYQPRQVVSLGINSNVARLYKALRFEVGIMSHFYIAGVRSSKLIKHVNGSYLNQIPSSALCGDLNQKEYRDISVILSPFVEKHDFQSVNTLKNSAYITHRYSNHPSYAYLLLQVKDRNSIIARLVCRKLSIGNESILRVVDIEMYLIPAKVMSFAIERKIKEFLIVNNLSYVDLVATTDVSRIAHSLGFLLKENGSTIPHHFEPYDPNNIDIMYAFRNYIVGNSELYGLKGDSDLDRPSLLN